MTESLGQFLARQDADEHTPLAIKFWKLEARLTEWREADRRHSRYAEFEVRTKVMGEFHDIRCAWMRQAEQARQQSDS